MCHKAGNFEIVCISYIVRVISTQIKPAVAVSGDANVNFARRILLATYKYVSNHITYVPEQKSTITKYIAIECHTCIFGIALSADGGYKDSM